MITPVTAPGFFCAKSDLFELIFGIRNHLVHLDAAKIGLVSVTCRDGDIVGVTVTNASAPPSWTIVSSAINATILIGTENITCDGEGGDQDSQILHRHHMRRVILVIYSVPNIIIINA